MAEKSVDPQALTAEQRQVVARSASLWTRESNRTVAGETAEMFRTPSHARKVAAELVELGTKLAAVFAAEPVTPVVDGGGTSGETDGEVVGQ